MIVPISLKLSFSTYHLIDEVQVSYHGKNLKDKLFRQWRVPSGRATCCISLSEAESSGRGIRRIQSGKEIWGYTVGSFDQHRWFVLYSLCTKIIEWMWVKLTFSDNTVMQPFI